MLANHEDYTDRTFPCGRRQATPTSARRRLSGKIEWSVMSPPHLSTIERSADRAVVEALGLAADIEVEEDRP
jgi:hypothetical protein